jgi:hypothetical protein
MPEITDSTAILFMTGSDGKLPARSQGLATAASGAIAFRKISETMT